MSKLRLKFESFWAIFSMLKKIDLQNESRADPGIEAILIDN